MRCVSPWYNCTGWLGVKHQLTYSPPPPPPPPPFLNTKRKDNSGCSLPPINGEFHGSGIPVWSESESIGSRSRSFLSHGSLKRDQQLSLYYRKLEHSCLGHSQKHSWPERWQRPLKLDDQSHTFSLAVTLDKLRPLKKKKREKKRGKSNKNRNKTETHTSVHNHMFILWPAS